MKKQNKKFGTCPKSKYKSTTVGNVETIKYGLDKVIQMRGVTYNKKDNGVKEVGVIAEEIYEVLPEVVLKNEAGEIDSVSYGRITAVLIEAIKDLKKEIEDLKANK